MIIEGERPQEPNRSPKSPRAILLDLVSLAREGVSVEESVVLFMFPHEDRRLASIVECRLEVKNLESVAQGTIRYYLSLGIPVPEEALPSDAHSLYRTVFLTLSESNEQLGVVSGQLDITDESSIIFNAFGAKNLSKEHRQPYVPGIVATMICRLVTEKVVDVFYSAPDSHHTPDGRGLFAYITENASVLGVHITKDADQEGTPWKITLASNQE